MISVETSRNADIAMRLYGHPFWAAHILSSQLEQLKEQVEIIFPENELESKIVKKLQKDNDRQISNLHNVISLLRDRAMGRLHIYFKSEGIISIIPYDVDDEMNKIGKPITSNGLLVLPPEMQSELEKLILAEQAYFNELVPVCCVVGKKYTNAYVRREALLTHSKKSKIEILDKDGNPILYRKKKMTVKKKSMNYSIDKFELVS